MTRSEVRFLIGLIILSRGHHSLGDGFRSLGTAIRIRGTQIRRRVVLMCARQKPTLLVTMFDSPYARRLLRYAVMFAVVVLGVAIMISYIP